jgi:DNA-binding response OmpR family regulator
MLSVMQKGYGTDEKVVLGTCTFSPQRMELETAEATIRLSHRESELLKILAANQNLPVQRRDILRSIWGDDSFFNSRTLDVYITRLRKYLKTDPDIEIVTLKGVGYQFMVK